MIDIIETNIESPLQLPLDGYFYKTLGALLTHIYISDMNWMGCFVETAAGGVDLEGQMGPVPSYTDQVFATFNEYKDARAKLDTLIARYVDALDEADLQKTTTKTNARGEKLDRVLWQALFHLFNHQTHHRDQVSYVLDTMQIENNYSNMILYS